MTIAHQNENEWCRVEHWPKIECGYGLLSLLFVVVVCIWIGKNALFHKIPNFSFLSSSSSSSVFFSTHSYIYRIQRLTFTLMNFHIHIISCVAMARLIYPVQSSVDWVFFSSFFFVAFNTLSGIHISVFFYGYKCYSFIYAMHMVCVRMRLLWWWLF